MAGGMLRPTCAFAGATPLSLLRPLLVCSVVHTAFSDARGHVPQALVTVRAGARAACTLYALR